jgi:hypothetical protein
VQIVHFPHRGSLDIQHIGSAHDAAGLELLKAAPRQRLAGGPRPIIEQVSKLDSLRVPEEAGVTPASYRTVTRRLRAFAADSRQQQISAGGYTRHGTLTIPVGRDMPDEDKPGWIVDGQQRSAAIRDARIDRFPVCVTEFTTESDEEQRSQFILVKARVLAGQPPCLGLRNRRAIHGKEKVYGSIP